jgi:hypothetical protein
LHWVIAQAEKAGKRSSCVLIANNTPYHVYFFGYAPARPFPSFPRLSRIALMVWLSDCSAKLPHGDWASPPPPVLAAGETAVFGSYSNG